MDRTAKRHASASGVVVAAVVVLLFPQMSCTAPINSGPAAEQSGEILHNKVSLKQVVPVVAIVHDDGWIYYIGGVEL